MTQRFEGVPEPGNEAQRNSWRVQRVGWTAMFALVLAASLGMLGNGLLSDREVTVPGNLTITYPGFMRRTRPEQIEVVTCSADSTIVLSIFGLARAGIVIQGISPLPQVQLATSGGQTFRWTVVPNATVHLSFTIAPQHSGRVQFTVQSDILRPSFFSAFVYP